MARSQMAKPKLKWKEDDRPQRYGWAPGSYLNKCSGCGDEFIGDKRAGSCADCAYGKPYPPQPEKPRLNGTAALLACYSTPLEMQPGEKSTEFVKRIVSAYLECSQKLENATMDDLAKILSDL
jgi:hypothetical protein